MTTTNGLSSISEFCILVEEKEGEEAFVSDGDAIDDSSSFLHSDLFPQ
ncbi:hypothetical protein AALP_AAs58846U000100 [Arabis alpina]|uniref:Uncharacterized protein n=1 Tax=Arabis alpina TaxID=50452 RepID=A0A087FY55_ARAAL|nr:hypothetical protein AALP_AAs58846U000100 [Arabis alpina]